MIEKKPRHRPKRHYPNAKRIIISCELNECVHCGMSLASRLPWHMRKTVQTMNGVTFVAGKSKECKNITCTHVGKHYYASGVLKYSLPNSTYGLDVLAFIGWQHEHEHKQFIEIHAQLNQLGIEINERNVGKLSRQFLALLGGAIAGTQEKLATTNVEHGGLIWAIDAVQPEGNGTLLYVLYEVLSGIPVSAIQLKQAKTQEIIQWLQPYVELPFTVLATLSDSEQAIITALKTCWSTVPHQRCQLHFLNNLSEVVLLSADSPLRQQLKADLSGLAKVPEYSQTPSDLTEEKKQEFPPFFYLRPKYLETRN